MQTRDALLKLIEQEDQFILNTGKYHNFSYLLLL